MFHVLGIIADKAISNLNSCFTNEMRGLQGSNVKRHSNHEHVWVSRFFPSLGLARKPVFENFLAGSIIFHFF